MEDSPDAASSAFCMLPVLLLFILVIAANAYILAFAPTKLPADHPRLTRLVALPHATTLAAMRALEVFPIKREFATEGGVVLVLSAPSTMGWTWERTYGHWLFVEVRSSEDGSEVALGIRKKWWEAGAKQERILEERLARLVEEVKSRLEAANG